MLAGAPSIDSDVTEEPEATRTLRVSATREDGWLFECARRVSEAVAGPLPPDGLLQVLLAEGYSTLLGIVAKDDPSGVDDIEQLEFDAAAELEAHAGWRAELRRWRSEAEVICEARLSLAQLEPSGLEGERHLAGAYEAVHAAFPVCGPSGVSAELLDRELRRLCSELAERDLALGIIAESARKADVWRRLGFASEAHYASERVGVSLSSLKAKRILAARAARMPELSSALASKRVGYEAAYLLSRVATPTTVEEWLRRAERRTVRHLREEVDTAELLIRMGHGRDQLPPDSRAMEEMFELERCIVSGDLLEGDCQGAGQMSGTSRAMQSVQRFGRVTFRWLVRDETARFWHALERAFLRVSTRVCRMRSSFLRFLCENFCRIWLPSLRRERLTESGEQPEYFDVYRRDSFRCTSPVCTRRDVTPHHLVFRSHGGGDESENVASLCVWCHLRGVHEGRVAAEPPASRMRWRIGRRGTLCVEGRIRIFT